MSFETIEHKIATWDDTSLQRLVHLALRLRHERDPEWKAEMARKIDDRTPGHWIGLDEAERTLDARRTAQGG